ncbi:MAG TPA: MAPEG family protein [Xanthomonadaceae bacterium]|nr:MAPEG family protein [Xanthomonadaceae bacterium]
MPRISLLFAALHTLLLLLLTVQVVRWRYRAKVGLGDGGNADLARQIRVHGNFIEYVPLALLLLALLELAGLDARALWSFGAMLLLGRLLHAFGLSRDAGPSPGRKWGMLLTWLALVGMALAGLWLVLLRG